MDIQSYIATGILELYVSGALTEQEMREVERMAHEYPEIKSELDEIESAFFNFANELHHGPRPDLKDQLLKNVKMNIGGPRVTPIHETKKITEAPVEVQPVKVVSIESNKTPYRFAFAASLALLIVSLVGLSYVWINWNNAEIELSDLKTKFEESNTRYASLNTAYSESQLMVGTLRSPHTLKLKLNGMPASPQSQAMVHWDQTNKKVLLDPMNLPATDANHDYQLWAIVDGKPVDLGTFSHLTNTDSAILPMNSVEVPQAFAITLEPKGGSVNPTMEQMYVMGKI